MKNTTNTIKTIFAVVFIIIATCNIANAGNPTTKKSAPKSKVTNPYYNPNKKLVNANQQPIFKRNRKPGEPIFNRRDQPILNIKHAPKRFQK
jgi:hypothetical protein